MVVLVPRQIRMSGMTGAVPYYGGRFSPAQAYAASHPRRTAPSPPPPPPASVPPAPRDPEAARAALDRLLADGVITAQEHADLRARVVSG